MKIGILQTGDAPDTLIDTQGDYPDMFHRLLGGRGFTFETFRVVDGVFPSGVEAADGWLVTGSKHGAYEDHDWIPPLEDLIRAIYADGRPMVGVCFGHQIIAQALGGRVEKFAGGWSVGRTEYDFDGEKLALNAWHQDQVVARPADARVEASTPFCENAALVYGERAWTIQPHPEFNAEVIDGLIRTRGKGIVPDDLLAAADAGLPHSTDSARIADRIAAFFKREGA